MKVCPYCSVKRRRYRVKIASVMYLGGQCKNCGYCKNLSALEFHHTGGGKDFTLSSSTHNKKWSEIKKELDKCVLLCANCHREEHNESEMHLRAAEGLIASGVHEEIAFFVKRFILKFSKRSIV